MSKPAIIEAVKTLDLAAARRLFEAKPALLSTTDREGRNLLHLASSVSVDDLRLPSRTQIQFAKFLLERGAKPSNAPGGGLFAAGWWDDVASLKLLIGAGAPVDVVVGVTPFLASWCWKRFAAAKVLALNGADVNYQDAKGRTALHHGVEKEFDPPLLRWLVKHGASPEMADRQGVTARTRASRKRDKRFVEALRVPGQQ
jgi:ankyrin repeat protein